MPEENGKPTGACALLLTSAAFLIAEEMVYRISTVGPEPADIPRIILFSVFYGALLTAFTLLLPEKARRPFFSAVLFAAATLFGFQYFVYMQFKVFYDLRTIFYGAADALGGFSSAIPGLVFSIPGILHLFLCYAPAVAARRAAGQLSDLPFQPAFSRVLVTAAAACFLLGQLVKADPALSSLFRDDYRYDTSIRRFGLLTGLLLDGGNLDGKEEPGFAAEAAPLPSAAPKKTAAARPAVLDIDFAGIGETASPEQKALDEYVRAQAPSYTNAMTGRFKGMNIIFITAEAFSKEVIDPVRTPALYRLYSKGIRFEDYYQPASAGTTGGEYQNLMGALPMYGGASMKMTADENNWFTLAGRLAEEDYEGWAFHNNDYTFYDRHLTHNNLGYSHGFTGCGNGLENYLSDLWPASDREMAEATLPMYIGHEPFQVYYMTVSGHNPYYSTVAREHIDAVEEGLPEDVRMYLAANMELEDAVAYLLEQLEEKGIAKRTVIVLTADHFPYGLDLNASFQSLPNLSALYGFQPENYLERDHNALLMWSGCLEEDDPIVVSEPVSSLDILPTLCNLFAVRWDSRLFCGRDVFSEKEPLVFTVNYDWKTDKGTYISAAGTFTPRAGVQVSDDYIESHNTIVRNKLRFCEQIQRCSYLTYIAEGIPPETDHFLRTEENSSGGHTNE